MCIVVRRLGTNNLFRSPLDPLHCVEKRLNLKFHKQSHCSMYNDWNLKQIVTGIENPQNSIVLILISVIAATAEVR